MRISGYSFIVMVATLFLFVYGNLAADDIEKQKLYMQFLSEEGYHPVIDDDGDVRFKSEGKTYYIFPNENDSAYFSLYYLNFWEIESINERRLALDAANVATKKSKCAKVFLTTNETCAGVELIFESPDDFVNVFSRAMQMLNHGVDVFVEEMQNE